MTDTARPDSQRDERDTPYRYTAALAAADRGPLAGPVGRRGDLRGARTRPARWPSRTRSPARPKSYVLDMFPYPSGIGLHVGHPLGYIATDVLRPVQADDRAQRPARAGLRRVRPARRAVRRADRPAPAGHHRGEHRDDARAAAPAGAGARPRAAASSTTDPEFYRWTQWIFLQVYNSWYDDEAGRARPIAELEPLLASGARPVPADVPGVPSGVRGPTWTSWTAAGSSTRTGWPTCRDSPVNWCPGLGTVLANEEVTAEGRSDRGNFPVFKRDLRQWMMRITAYAPRLLTDLDALDWPESIKLQQRNWIGRSEGARVTFPSEAGAIEVFTTRPDTLFGATFMVVAPEHPLVDLLASGAWPDRRTDRRGPGERPRRATRSRPTAGPPSCAPTWSGRPRVATRPACSPAPSPPTRSTARRSRCSSPTTC